MENNLQNINPTGFGGLAILLLSLVIVAGCANMSRISRPAHEDYSRVAMPATVVDQFSSATTPQLSDHKSDIESNLADRVHEGVLPISLYESIQIALSNSNTLRVIEGNVVKASDTTVFDIQSAKARETAALAAFDATLESVIYGRDLKRPSNSIFGPGLAQPQKRDEASLNFAIRKPLTTGGQASAAYNPDPGYFFISNPSGSGLNPLRTATMEFSLKQPLLRGAGREINFVPIQISQIGIDQSTWEFKNTTMASVRSIVTAYWNLYSARAALSAIDEVIPLFDEIVRVQNEAMKAGMGIQGDVAKAEAQLSDFRQQKLAIESDVITRELQLRSLMGISARRDWSIIPSSSPINTKIDTDVEMLLQQAIDCRPDIVKQRLNVRIRQLELAVADNNLKPDFDINALYRLNGNGENLGQALDLLSTMDFYDWEVGARFSVALGRRAAHAGVYNADRRLGKESDLLTQEVFTTYHRLAESLQVIEYTHKQFEEATKRLDSAVQWVEGAQLRYKNPNPENNSGNWLLENLNDYLNAIRFKSRAAAEKAELLAEYNIQLARLEELRGTLLENVKVQFVGDPCAQTDRLFPLAEHDFKVDQDAIESRTGFEGSNPWNSAIGPESRETRASPTIDAEWGLPRRDNYQEAKKIWETNSQSAVEPNQPTSTQSPPPNSAQPVRYFERLQQIEDGPTRNP